MQPRAGLDEPAVATLRARWLPRAELVVAVVLVLGVVAALAAQWNVGRADNGDFSRIMTWLTSRPVGFDVNWPPADSPDWPRRFGQFYLPEWVFDVGLSRVGSSVVVLWLPGAALNWVFVSQDVLHLGVVSLAPRLLLAAAPLGFWLYLRRRLTDAGHRLLVLVLAGVPLALVITNRDYVSFLNSFYQEAGSLTYAVGFVAALLALRLWPGQRWVVIVALIGVALLSATKMSSLYWPWLGLAALAIAAGWRRPRTLAALGVLALVLTAVGYQANLRSIDPRINTFHAVFNGALTLSNDPAARLRELGYPSTAIDCIGQSAFLPRGADCYRELRERVSRLDQLRILAAEPSTAVGLVTAPASAMQETYFGLGEFPEDGAGPVAESWQLATWSHAKRAWLPTGAPLVIGLVLLVAVGAVSARRTGMRRDMGIVVATLALAALADMTVAFVGDGRQELSKHLLLANWLVDLALVAAIALAVAWAVAGRSPDSGPRA